MDPDKPTRSPYAVMILSIGLVWGVLAAGIAYLIADARRTASAREQECKRIVEAIREYQQRAGRLPASLDEAGVTHDTSLSDTVIYRPAWNGPLRFSLTCNKHYWGPVPRIHWWYYDSEQDTWDYENEGV
jgi:hypothetical protein